MIKLINESVSSEILKFGYKLNKKGIMNWLKINNIMPLNAELICYKDLVKWRRGGAETYLARASIEYSIKGKVIKRCFVLKALVALFPEILLNTWLQRRSILASLNINVAYWFNTHPGLIIEQYYPSNINMSINRSNIIENLSFIAGVLDGYGFLTMNFLDDLRVIKNDIYYIDFGQDLGDPLNSTQNSALSSLKGYCLKKQLKIVTNEYNSGLDKGMSLRGKYNET